MSPAQPVRKQKIKRRKSMLLPFAGIFLLCFGAVIYFRPLPSAKLQLSLAPVPPPQTISLDWPTFGQAALGSEQYGEIGTSGNNTPIATASIAKVITALCVLEKKPIPAGEKGAVLTIQQIDVDNYQQQIAQNGSRLAVYQGENMTEYEALQALMVPSANNIADTLAVWAFGSMENYAAYANAYLARHGLVSTKVGKDASGLDPSTRSSAEDLMRLGLLALKNPTLMEIAGQKEVTFTYGGTFTNYNTALGTYGITGLKTGNNDENPGALLFTASVSTGHQPVQISGAVLGGDSLPQAITAAESLAASIPQNFEVVQLVQKNKKVGTLKTAWGTSTDVFTRQGATITRWRSHSIRSKVTPYETSGTTAGAVGKMDASTAGGRVTTEFATQQPAPAPSAWWRLTHIR